MPHQDREGQAEAARGLVLVHNSARVLTGYEDEAREHGTRVGRANDKGGAHSLSQCGCRPGLRWSIMQGVCVEKRRNWRLLAQMAQRSALRHAAARSSAPAPRARVEHAHQRCVPERHPSDQRTRKEHCSPHHSTCAHRSLSRALLRHILEKKPRDTNKRGTINAQITARERLRRTRLRLARAPPDVSRDPAHRDRTSDASAAPIALDLLWFGTARANLLAWQGPHSGHFARQRPTRLP